MDINRICFDPENYKNKNEMWNDITATIQVLFKNQYVVVMREEDFGIVTIEYEYDEHINHYGCANPYWITEEEYRDVLTAREVKDEAEE